MLGISEGPLVRVNLRRYPSPPRFARSPACGETWQIPDMPNGELGRARNEIT